MASTIRGNDNFDTVGSSNTSIRLAKAWIVYDQLDPVTILASYNCSSITDREVGISSVNMTNAISSVNYSVSASTVGNTTSWGGTTFVSGDNSYGKTTTQFSICIRKYGGTYGIPIDVNNISAIVFAN
tara:strand:- start:7 stop:390 length:384 start_codon:yes stop_codon:yes gene_type:complete